MDENEKTEKNDVEKKLILDDSSEDDFQPEALDSDGEPQVASAIDGEPQVASAIDGEPQVASAIDGEPLVASAIDAFELDQLAQARHRPPQRARC